MASLTSDTTEESTRESCPHCGSEELEFDPYLLCLDCLSCKMTIGQRIPVGQISLVNDSKANGDDLSVPLDLDTEGEREECPHCGSRKLRFDPYLLSLDCLDCDTALGLRIPPSQTKLHADTSRPDFGVASHIAASSIEKTQFQSFSVIYVDLQNMSLSKSSSLYNATIAEVLQKLDHFSRLIRPLPRQRYVTQWMLNDYNFRDDFTMSLCPDLLKLQEDEWSELAADTPAQDKKYVTTIRKSGASAFAGTSLARQLHQGSEDIKEVIVCGVDTFGAVSATIMDALSAGFRPVLLKDACIGLPMDCLTQSKFAEVITVKEFGERLRF